jgi:hypothetical protein
VLQSPYAEPRVARQIELIEPGRLIFSGPVKKRPAFESLLLKNAFHLEKPVERADGTLPHPGHGLPCYTDPLTAAKAGAPNSGHTPGTLHPADLDFHIAPGDHKKVKVCKEKDCPHVGQTEKRANPLTEHLGKRYEDDAGVTFVTCEWHRPDQIHDARFIAEGCGWTLRAVTAQGKILVQDEVEHPEFASIRRELDVLRELLNMPPRMSGGVANSPAWAMQAGSHSAQLARQSASLPWNAAGGVVNAGDYAVTQNGTPNMTVNVAGGVPGGRILIPRTGTQYAGLYFGYNDASVSLTGFTAPSANTWISTVYAQAEDAAYGDATTVFHLAFATGSAASSPVAPSLAVSSMALANIAIASTTTSITTGLITNVVAQAELLGVAMFRPVRYHASTTPSFSSSYVPVPVDTLDYDKSGGAYSVSGGLVTVPAAGSYLVSGDVGGSGGGTYALQAAIGHNGVASGRSAISLDSVTTTTAVTVSDVVICAAGDTLCIYAQASAGGFSSPGSSFAPGNSITVMRVS